MSGRVGEVLMRVSRSGGRWLRLPSRIALLLGLGALSAAGARADAALDRPGCGVEPLSHGDPANVGELLIRAEGGRIYLAEGGLAEGAEFRELQLRDIPEAHLLQQLIEENGASATGIRL